MKILFITARTDLGGGPKHLLDLLKSLTNTENYLAAPIENPFGPELQKYCKANIAIKKRSFSIIDFFKILFFLYKYKIKIIHSHGRGAGLYSRLLKFFGFKVVHTFHGVHREAGLIGTIKYLTDRVLAPYANFYICVSSDEKVKAGTEYFLDVVKTSVVNNGVDLNEFKYQQPKPTLSVMGCMARVSYQKGYEVLFSNLLLLKNVWPDFVFKIAGPNPGEINIPFELKDNCEVLGPCSAANFLKTIDLYVSCSRWEGMPLAVIESMAVGVPCLLSNVVGHQYFINENQVCMGFELQDQTEFTHKIIKLKDSLELRNKLSSNAKNLIIKEHSSIGVANKVKEIYNEIDK